MIYHWNGIHPVTRTTVGDKLASAKTKNNFNQAFKQNMLSIPWNVKLGLRH